jgi:acyl carrier protein
LGSLTPEEGTQAFAQIFDRDVAQTAVMHFNLPQWAKTYTAAAKTALFAEMREGDGEVKRPSSNNLRQTLLDTPPGKQRRNLFTNHLRQEIAQVLRLSPQRIPLNKPLKSLGLDSLMTIELRNRLETSMGLTLSATLIWNYPSVEALIPFLAEKMGVLLEGDSEEKTADPEPEEDNTATELQDLSQTEIEDMLAAELAEIDDLLKGI